MSQDTCAICLDDIKLVDASSTSIDVGENITFENANIVQKK